MMVTRHDDPALDYYDAQHERYHGPGDRDPECALCAQGVAEDRLTAAAKEWYDSAMTRANFDTTHTSRPDAYPLWDDLTPAEQGEVEQDYVDLYGEPDPAFPPSLCASCAADGEPHEHDVTHCERCGRIINPMPSYIGARRED